MSETKSTKPSFLTVTLKYPITLGSGDTLSEITLRRPKAKDIRQVQRDCPNNQEEQGFTLAQLVSGLIPEDFDEIDIEDFQTIGEKVTAMVGKSQPKKS